MIQKTFYKTLLEFNQFPLKARQCLNDKRLTQIEKRILEGYLFIRNNQNREAIALLQDLPASEFEFIEAQKKLVLGIALNNISDFNKSEKYLLEAIKILRQQEISYFEFIGLFNLYFIYSNSGKIEKMEETLLQMDSLKLETEIQVIRVLRCKFDFYSESEKLMLANETLAQLEPLKCKMSESDIIAQLVCEFSFHIKYDELKKCQMILEEMKKHRKFQLTENYNFMKKMLEHLTNNSPIYFYADDFKSVSLLHNQLKLIHALEDLDFKTAKETWEKLMISFPETYLPDFEFVGQKCLFSLCLDKHLKSHTLQREIPESDSSFKVDLLLRVLASSGKPMSKGELYELIWNETPNNKEDLQKLARLISRARKERNIEIKSRKGTYYFVGLLNLDRKSS